MSDNKQNEVLTGYEQLKRRNRRRLVMASGLVAASTVLLGVALSTGPENKPEENAQTTTIQQNNANAEPANLADATVLEPSTKEDLEAAAEAAKNADAEDFCLSRGLGDVYKRQTRCAASRARRCRPAFGAD